MNVFGTVRVRTGKPYDVKIGRGLLPGCGDEVRRVLPKAARCVIVSDSHVAPLYAGTVRQSLEAAGYRTAVHVFPAGEENKRLSVYSGMVEAFAAAGLSRSDFAVALGGGVTGDMCGFAAATYLRGIPFVQIPTTVLAQNDSSVGGKTGADLDCGKNLVGSFHQPCLVLADADTLRTLPPRYVTDGFGEIIKHGCIRSAELFGLIGRYGADLTAIEELTARSVAIKAAVVERDEKESGERMLLNFGHTIGHAIETCAGYTGFSHGEAVGVGMLIMARAAARAGLPACSGEADADRIEEVLQKCGMPVSCPFTPAQLCEAAMHDKKRRGDTMNLVLLHGIGDAFVYPIACGDLTDFVAKGMDVCRN